MGVGHPEQGSPPRGDYSGSFSHHIAGIFLVAPHQRSCRRATYWPDNPAQPARSCRQPARFAQCQRSGKPDPLRSHLAQSAARRPGVPSGACDRLADRILMGALGSVRSTFEPLVTASGYIPIATLVPLTMSWFGTDELQKVVFLAMAFGIFLLPMVINAIDSVPEVYLRTSYTLGANRRQAILRVLIPIALPDIWHRMRLAFGVGWTYLVLAEVVVKNGGLGDLIDTARRRALSGRVYLVIVVITLIAWVADLGWERAGRLLFPYRRSRS